MNTDLRSLGARSQAPFDPRVRPVAAGLASGRPAANLVRNDRYGGSFYYETDTGVLWYSNGISWVRAPSDPRGFSAVGARVYRVSAQSIPNATDTVISMDTESFDTSGFHDNAVNNSRLTVPSGYDGIYVITASVEFDYAANGFRQLWILKNGALVLVLSRVPVPTADSVMATVTTIDRAAAGSYYEMFVYQSSGGALNVNVFSASSPHFSIAMLGA